MRETFDVVFGIGEACSCTQALRAASLQYLSFPFDWLYGSDIVVRTEILCGNFRDIIDETSLEFVGQDHNKDAYKNAKNGIVFNHDFPIGVPLSESYPEIKKKYDRRAQRLIALIENASRILMVCLVSPAKGKNVLGRDAWECRANECIQLLKNRFGADKMIKVLVIENDLKIPYRDDLCMQVSGSVEYCAFNYKRSGKGCPDYATRTDLVADFLMRHFLMPDYRTVEEVATYKAYKRRLQVEDMRKLGATSKFDYFIKRRIYKLRKHFRKRRIGGNSYLPRTGEPLVSVCIPAYNHERYVERTIRSVMAQTYKRIELIVIDDGSSDKTWDVIQSLREECDKRFERVIFETQQNQGTCVTGNRLFSIANGEYVSLIASDDELLPIAVETLMIAMQSGDYVLAVGDNYIIDGNSNRIAWDANRNTTPLDDGEYKTFWSFFSRNLSKSEMSSGFGSYSSLIRHNYIPNGYLIRRSSFLKTGGYNPSAPLEDWYMMLQLSKIGRFAFVDKPLFNYRWHGANTSCNHRRMAEMSITTVRFEESLLKKANDSMHLRYFRKHSPLRHKTILKIPHIISICDCHDFDVKYREVVFLGHRFYWVAD